MNPGGKSSLALAKLLPRAFRLFYFFNNARKLYCHWVHRVGTKSTMVMISQVFTVLYHSTPFVD